MVDFDFILKEFVLTPLDSETDAGSTLIWNCTATGYPTPVITWEKDGILLLPGNLKHISILANNSLRIEGVSSKDAGQYQCSAGNAIGIHVVRAELRVRGEKTTVKLEFFDVGCLEETREISKCF